MIPVEHTRHRKEVVEGGGIGDIPNEGVDPGLVIGEPGRVESTNYGGSIDEVTIARNFSQY
jgi:hypothetical protein